jgi:hypothetical protein
MNSPELTAPKKMGIMISADPKAPPFKKGLEVSKEGLREGAQVYLYLIDNAVAGAQDPLLHELKNAGVHLYACAYSLQLRGLAPPPEATLAGLTILSDIMASADDFKSFN